MVINGVMPINITTTGKLYKNANDMKSRKNGTKYRKGMRYTNFAKENET